MAIYHLQVKIFSRAHGHSVVAAAAYRAGAALTDEASTITHDYRRKEGVEHAEILAPEGAPDWVFDRARLWNSVEACERRRDAQLAREAELGLPIELDPEAQRTLLRDFVQSQFVAQGMIADLAIHRDNPHNPHAHVLLTMRRIGAQGFGPKERRWNALAQLLTWRAAWTEVTNAHLARAGLAVRIDDRTLTAQGLTLEPGRKIGVSRERQAQPDLLPARIADRVEEQRRIAHENGERIRRDPRVALRALTHQQATFTERELARFLHTRTEGAAQFQAAMLKVMASRELIALGQDERGHARYTSREMLTLERSLFETAAALSARSGHGVAAAHPPSALAQTQLTGEQGSAFDTLIGAGDLKALIGVAGSGKSRLLAATRLAWEAEGYTVKGAALSGLAAEALTLASGIPARTLASFEWAWAQGREPLTARDVLVIDEAGLLGTRQLQHVLTAAHTAHAKLVLVGDPEQLQAIEAGAPFRALTTHSAVAELQQVQRQRAPWQRKATQQLAGGATAQALCAYEAQGAVLPVPTRESAYDALLARWAHDGAAAPKITRLILAYTRADVQTLNARVRTLRQQRGELGLAASMATTRGAREFAVHDRLAFLRNEKSLGVKNGSLGTLEAIEDGLLQVRLDGPDERRIIVDTRFYQDLEHGYAATVHKAQGATVDRTYVLASPHFDRHATYVALSRHREAVTLFYAQEDFSPGGAQADPSAAFARARLIQTLSRARPKELAHDYLELERSATASLQRDPASRVSLHAIDQRQQQAAERARTRQPSAPSPSAPSAVDFLYDPSRTRGQAHERGGPEEDWPL